jgi:hypothetical protein
MMHGICIKIKRKQSLLTSISFLSVFTSDYFLSDHFLAFIDPRRNQLVKDQTRTKLYLNFRSLHHREHRPVS